MKLASRRCWRRILLGFSLYLIVWLFLGGFLVVYTRSYNRMTHQPVAVAQLTLSPESATIALADRSATWQYPAPPESLCLWLGTWPGVSTNTALFTWQLLWDDGASP